MMGVYVKGMEMPKSCSDCLFLDGLYDANDELRSACLAKEDNSPSGCGYKVIDGIDHMARRMDYCPLVEVSEPHGRLIDADYLREHLYICETNGRPLHIMELDERLACIDEVPIVIEAESE